VSSPLHPAALAAPFVVGFDLDMTLVDSRPGIAATYRALTAQTGVYIDADAAVSRLGPPLDGELARWFPADQVAGAGDLFRALYPAHAVTTSPALPGVAAALAAVRARPGRIVVITGKYEPNARRHLDHLGLTVDALVGWAWGAGKTTALGEHQAHIYVGDHPEDMASAVAGGVVAVGVGTGGWSTADLLAAGAQIVLNDLTEFPTWLADQRF
jgi:phosphoglycolate phosphatase